MDLTAREKNLLVKLIVQYGQLPIHAEREEQVGLIELCRKGILTRYHSDWDEVIYVLPHAQLQHWNSILLAPLRTVPTTSSVLSVMSKLSEYLIRVWQGILIHGLKKTTNDTYHKQYWNKILKQLPNSYQSYSLEWLIEQLFHLCWIQQNRKEIIPNLDSISNWLSCGRRSREHVIYQLWKKVNFPREVWKQLVLLQLERLPAGRAVEAEACTDWLEQVIKVKSDLPPSHEIKEWLDHLNEEGWIECMSQEQNAAKCYRWFNPSVEDSPCAPEWIIQSNDEVLIPPGASLGGLEDLLARSELVQTDPVWVLRERQTNYVGERMEPPPSTTEWNTKQEFPDFIYEQLRHFRLDTTLPKISDLYPRLRTIPSVWLNKCRGYHLATYRSMIEEALANRGLLKIIRLNPTTSGKQVLLIAPERLIDQDGHWVLTANLDHQPTQFSLKQIKAMQLILPGFNDASHERSS